MHFNVFQADAIVLPELQVRPQLEQAAVGDVTLVPTAVGDFEVATVLLTPHRMAVVRGELEHAVRTSTSISRFSTSLRGELSHELEEDELTAAVASATWLLGRMRELHKDDRNDVWARVIEQAIAPQLLAGVDLVVGNPPWVSWKALPDAWKSRSEPLWRAYGLWQRRQRGGGVPLSDVSTLLLARALTTYAPQGTTALLLPESVLLADPSGAAFRRSHLRPNDEDRRGVGDPDVRVRVLAVEDFVALDPFSPDASNRTIALFARAHQAPTFPVPLRSWQRARRGARLVSTASWTYIAGRLAPVDRAIAPIDPADHTSPWGLTADEPALALRPRSRLQPYDFGRGYETRGLDGLFTYHLTTAHPAAGLVRLVNLPEAGDNTRGERPREGTVEPDLLWPLVKGEDVERWRAAHADRFIFVPYQPQRKTPEIHVDECARRFPRLFRYLEVWLDRMARRSMYRGEPSEDFPWGLSGPVEYLRADGALVFIRYIASGGRPAAAVAEAAHEPRLGRSTLPLPNNKSNILYTDSKDEAHFIAAFINSTPAQDALARFAVSTGVTPGALARLPLPRFNARDPAHQRLAQLGWQAAAAHARGDQEGLAGVETQLDEHVWAVENP